MRWPRSPTQLALDATAQPVCYRSQHLYRYCPRYIDASIAIACTRNLEKSPLPLRVRHLRALRRATAESYRCTDGVRSSRGAEVPSAAISDRDRSSVGAFRRQRIVGEGCAILEETVAESGTKAGCDGSPRNERFHFRSLAGARDSSPST